jgi:hypothetical protein
VKQVSEVTNIARNQPDNKVHRTGCLGDGENLRNPLKLSGYRFNLAMFGLHEKDGLDMQTNLGPIKDRAKFRDDSPRDQGANAVTRSRRT